MLENDKLKFNHDMAMDMPSIYRRIKAKKTFLKVARVAMLIRKLRIPHVVALNFKVMPTASYDP